MWYEIARMPQKFEYRLVCVTTTYKRRSDNLISSENNARFATPSGKATHIKGKGFSTNKENTKLKIAYVLDIFQDYWILDLSDDYEWALIGDPTRKGLWIISRNPTLDNSVIDPLINLAKKYEFPVDTIIYTYQGSDC